MCVCVCVLPTSGENFMSTALLEIHLLRKLVTCSILILPAVCINELFSVHSVVNLFNPLMIQRKSSFNKKEEIIIPPFNRDEQIVTP